MKKLLLLVVLMFLVSCAPVDPYQARDLAISQIEATERARQIEMENALEQARQATMQAAATAGAAQAEIQLLNAQIEATRVAIDVAMQSGQATRQSGEVTRIAQSYELSSTKTAVSMNATSTAIVSSAMMEIARVERQEMVSEFVANAMPLFLLVLGVALVSMLIVIIIAIKRYLEYRMIWLDRHNSIIDARQGTIIFDYDGVPRLLGDLSVTRYNKFTNTKTAKQIVNAEISDPPEGRVNALSLVSASIRENGGDSVQVSSWRAINWSSSRWQDAVQYLRGVGVLDRADPTGTYLTEELDTVKWKLETNSLPTPD